jgi:hypothetical protein
MVQVIQKSTKVIFLFFLILSEAMICATKNAQTFYFPSLCFEIVPPPNDTQFQEYDAETYNSDYN